MVGLPHENGCPWDQDACFNAASNGHLEVLKYLHQNGCPWNEEDCLEVAKSNRHLKVVEWYTTTVCLNGSENLDKIREDRKHDRNDDKTSKSNKRCRV